MGFFDSDLFINFCSEQGSSASGGVKKSTGYVYAFKMLEFCEN